MRKEQEIFLKRSNNFEREFYKFKKSFNIKNSINRLNHRLGTVKEKKW